MPGHLSQSSGDVQTAHTWVGSFSHPANVHLSKSRLPWLRSGRLGCESRLLICMALANRSANTHTLTHTRTLTTRVVTHNCECLLCACVSALIFFRFLWFLWGANAAYVQRVVNKMEALAQSKGPIIYAQTLPTFPQQMQHKRDFRLPFHWPPQSVRYSGENRAGTLILQPDSGYSSTHMSLPQCDGTRIQRQPKRQKELRVLSIFKLN